MKRCRQKQKSNGRRVKGSLKSSNNEDKTLNKEKNIPSRLLPHSPDTPTTFIKRFVSVWQSRGVLVFYMPIIFLWTNIY